MPASQRIVLHFPHTIVDKPIVCQLIKDYNLVFNILRASITPEKEGLMVLEVTGDERAHTKGIEYLTGLGVKVEPLSQDIRRNDEKCTHCGLCVSVCPSGALAIIDRTSMEVKFDDTKCVACETCIKSCPTRAMELHF